MYKIYIMQQGMDRRLVVRNPDGTLNPRVWWDRRITTLLTSDSDCREWIDSALYRVISIGTLVHNDDLGSHNSGFKVPWSNDGFSMEYMVHLDHIEYLIMTYRATAEQRAAQSLGIKRTFEIQQYPVLEELRSKGLI